MPAITDPASSQALTEQSHHRGYFTPNPRGDKDIRMKRIEYHSKHWSKIALANKDFKAAA